jgi:hypothetical protein
MTTRQGKRDSFHLDRANAGLCLLVGTLVAVSMRVAAPTDALGYASGPPDAHAGDPPAAMTCVQCHSSFALNSGDGDLRLLNAPSAVVPGKKYDLMIELLDPGQSRWGFELTALDEAANNAGQIIVTDPARTQLTHDTLLNRDYLKHTTAGTDAATPGPTQWAFQWVAPQIFNSITFYFTGNAADNSDFFFGDYIYSRSVTLLQTAAVDPSTWGEIKGLFRGTGR